MVRLMAILLPAIVMLLAGAAEAHRSGCHLWHSCPSDTRSYVCGDLGYSNYCPKKPALRKPVREAPTAFPSQAAPSSNVVAVVQYLLMDLGYDPGSPDGQVGPKTRAAIIAYQGRKQLARDGKVSGTLLTLLSFDVARAGRK